MSVPWGLLAVGLLGVAGWFWHADSASGGVTRGLASGMDLVETLSPAHARREALHTRPGKRVHSWTPVREVGIDIGRVAGLSRRRIVATLEDVVLYIAGPRTGKTGALARHVQDAPGAVLCTSTKPDLWRLTIKSRRLRPVWVFNPKSVGVDERGRGPVSTLRWSPVLACVDVPTTWLIAALHVSAGATGGQKEAEYWEANATRALRLLLAAAAVGGRDMHEVYAWAAALSDPDITARPATLLDTPAARHRFRGWGADLRDLLAKHPKTLDSISMTLLNCLQYMADPALAHAATPGVDEHFTPGYFLASGGSIYVIGQHEEQSPVGPLFSTFIGYTYQHLRGVAAASRGERLDPPCPFVLDEATNTFRTPLPRWTSDAGSHGIPLIIAVQGRNQLTEAFGADGAATIWQNATTKVTFGGQMSPDTVRDLSELGGERPVHLGSDTMVPVLTPGQIRTLPKGTAYVLHRATRPVLARIPMVWSRWRPPVARPLIDEPESRGAVVRLDDRR